MERIADAIQCEVKEITMAAPDGCIENVIEFLKDEKRATVTFSQGRYKSRIRKLAAAHPEECQIVAENKDGSICAHIPVDWIRINPSRELTDEEKERLSEHARNVLNHSNNRCENG